MDVTYTSCAHVQIPGFNLQGEPWCATEVRPDDGITVKEHKWSLCQDERGLILDDDGKNIRIHTYIHNTIFYPCGSKLFAK